jgi:protein TonB
MRKNKVFNFRVGLCISLCFHLLLAFGIYCFSKPKATAKKTQNITPLVLSLSNFIETKEIAIQPQKPFLPTKSQSEKSKKPIVEKPKIEETVKVIEEETAHRVVDSSSFFEKTTDIVATQGQQPSNADKTIHVDITDTAITSNGQLSNADKEDLRKILNAINKHKNYPEVAKRKNIEGVVYVKFVVTKNGDVADILVTKSSGSKILDTSAIKTIEVAKKSFPHLSKDFSVAMSLNYYLYK